MTTNNNIINYYVADGDSMWDCSEQPLAYCEDGTVCVNEQVSADNDPLYREMVQAMQSNSLDDDFFAHTSNLDGDVVKVTASNGDRYYYAADCTPSGVELYDTPEEAF